MVGQAAWRKRISIIEARTSRSSKQTQDADGTGCEQIS